MHHCVSHLFLCLVFVFIRYLLCAHLLFFFFFNDTATTEIYTLSLHDALPIRASRSWSNTSRASRMSTPWSRPDRKSTRLNSSHLVISYAVFCLKKKNNNYKLYNNDKKEIQHIHTDIT